VSGSRAIHWEWLGRRAYGEVHSLQLQLRDELLAGRGRPTLLLVEHDPVVTLGRRAGDDALIAGADLLAARGIEVVRVERGGQATYHGPGQLVGYPILPLPRFGLDVPTFVAHLEGTMADVAIDLGLAAGRRQGYPGVWVGRAKIGAVGVHLRRLISIHGFALNLDPDLDAYRLIVPCGLLPADGEISSVARLAGSAPSAADLAPEVAARLIRRILGT
jgi:lipoate-protein ligase B